MLVGDALAVPGHWFYSPTKLRKDYGEIDGMVAPKATHAESMIQGMSYNGSIDILHDKAIYYEGSTAVAASTQKQLSKEDIQKRRDDHGNYVGVTEDERVHYHQSFRHQKGMNTTNACIARLLMRYLAKTNSGQQDLYDPDQFLEEFQTYMTTAPDPKDTSQIKSHNDTYLDVYARYFFTQASQGTRLRNCAMSQRDQWSIGSLDGVVMSIPIIAAYADEPEAMVLGRVVEHHMLTHRSVSVTMVASVLVSLLLGLYKGQALRPALEVAMSKLRPPKCTGREMRDSYVDHRGPGNIPKHEKWLQHMTTTDEDFLELIQSFLANESDDENVGGWGDRPHSRFSTACYCEQTIAIVLYLAYKYHDNPRKALLQNVMLGGHSTSRGAVLGAILGAAHGADQVPFQTDLAAYSYIQQEIDNVIATI